MQFEVEQDYPASLDRLWAVFGHPAYPEKKYRTLGARSFKLIRAEVNPSQIEIELERVSAIAMDKVPDWGRKFMKEEQILRHYSLWKRSGDKVQAQLRITPVGIPVSVEGTGRITQTAPGQCRVSLRFDVGCKVPLLGGKVEKIFAEQVRKGLDADYNFTLGYLKDAD